MARVELLLREGGASVVRINDVVDNADDIYTWIGENVKFEDLFIGTPRGRVKAPRRAKAYATSSEFATYRYGGQTTQAEFPIPPELYERALRVAQILGHPPPNFLLVQEYPEDGCIHPHADDEPEIVRDSDIISESYGHERDFVFHPKAGGREVKRIRLHHGSVVAMRGSCQRVFKHSVPRATKRNPCPPTRVAGKLTTTRYNLTFRRMRGGIPGYVPLSSRRK